MFSGVWTCDKTIKRHRERLTLNSKWWFLLEHWGEWQSGQGGVHWRVELYCSELGGRCMNFFIHIYKSQTVHRMELLVWMWTAHTIIHFFEAWHFCFELWSYGSAQFTFLTSPRHLQTQEKKTLLKWALQ